METDSEGAVESSAEKAIKQDNYLELRTLISDLDVSELECLLFISCDNGAENCAAILLNAGVDKDCLDCNSTTLLMHAVKSGSLEIVRLLITWGSQINTLGGVDNNSALHLAAAEGHPDICEALIAAGANVNGKNGKEDTPLIVASINGHLAIVKLLLHHHASINRRGYHECSALHEATEHGHYEVCAFLLTAKAGLEDDDTFGNTPLIVAAEKGHVNLVLLFLAQGAEVNKVSHSGATALHYAAKEGCITCCKVLLHHGAEIDAQDIRRFTPLMMACLMGHEEILRLMLDARCNVNMVAYNRRTALHYAAERGYSRCCQILIESGACLESLDADKYSAVMLAAWKGNLETLQLLISLGANIHCWSRFGMSVLHLAAEGGSIGCCKTLIDHGVSMDIRCCDGVTPVICAIRCLRMRIVNFFISQGCKLERLPGDVVTALNEAVYRNIDTSVISRMLVHGACPNTMDRFHTLPLWHAVDNCNFSVVKLLLLYNSDYSKQTESMLAPCSPCSPITHAVHKGNQVLINWLVAAYAEEATLILRKMNLLYTMFNLRETSTAQLVKELTSRPQSLLCQCRRAIRKQMGSGVQVTEKIACLKLPTLLHNYMLFSDMDLPEDPTHT